MIVKFIGLPVLRIDYPDKKGNASSLWEFFSKRFMDDRDEDDEDSENKHGVFKRMNDFLAGNNNGVFEENIKNLSMKSLKITNIRWYTTIGVTEADKTAWLSGFLWTLKACLFGLIENVFLRNSLEKPLFMIQPDYSQVFTFQTHFTCMIRFRLGHAILTGYKIAKQVKGRQETCQKNIQFKV